MPAGRAFVGGAQGGNVTQAFLPVNCTREDASQAGMPVSHFASTYSEMPPFTTAHADARTARSPTLQPPLRLTSVRFLIVFNEK
jgi:hypothetical protein